VIETQDLPMTATQAFTIFETGIGPCAIAWADQGIIGVQLPEPSEREMRARMRRRFPAATEPPPPYPLLIQSAIAAIVALLDGQSSDLSSIALDMHGVPEFHQRVYAVARTIPPGATLSYGEIAARLGEPAWPAARDVGQALAQNPFPIVVPCHRVLAANGKLGGFSARGGTTTKLRLLSIEIASSSAWDKQAGPSAGGGSAAAFNIPMFTE
jgi:methylated-DNA-[protein]-cysteine S-methyltransferase